MSLYELTDEDVQDLRTISMAGSLTIAAPFAQRLAALQVKLAELAPSDARAQLTIVEVAKRMELERVLTRVDQLNEELALARKEVDALGAKLVALQPNSVQALCMCGHSKARHEVSGVKPECIEGKCDCQDYEPQR